MSALRKILVATQPYDEELRGVSASADVRDPLVQRLGFRKAPENSNKNCTKDRPLNKTAGDQFFDRREAIACFGVDNASRQTIAPNRGRAAVIAEIRVEANEKFEGRCS